MFAWGPLLLHDCSHCRAGFGLVRLGLALHQCARCNWTCWTATTAAIALWTMDWTSAGNLVWLGLAPSSVHTPRRTGWYCSSCTVNCGPCPRPVCATCAALLRFGRRLSAGQGAHSQHTTETFPKISWCAVFTTKEPTNSFLNVALILLLNSTPMNSRPYTLHHHVHWQGTDLLATSFWRVITHTLGLADMCKKLSVTNSSSGLIFVKIRATF